MPAGGCAADQVVKWDGGNWVCADTTSVQVKGTTDFSMGSTSWIQVSEMSAIINLSTQSSVKLTFSSTWISGPSLVAPVRINRDSGAEYISLGNACCTGIAGDFVGGIYIFEDLPAGSYSFSIEIKSPSSNVVYNNVNSNSENYRRVLILEAI